MKRHIKKNPTRPVSTLAFPTIWLLYAVFAICYYRYLWHHVENFPRSDDFRAVLDALILWRENKSVSNFFAILFSQYNEHKILIVRLVSILVYELEGSVNFQHLTLIGNLFFISIPLAFLVDRKLPAYFYLAIFPLFFSATTYGSSYWAMTSLSNLPVVWFACWAVQFAFHPSRRLNWAALVLAFLATFSQGNGIAVLLLLTAYAFFRWDSALKIGYLLTFVGATALFFFNWHRPPNPSLAMALSQPLAALKFFLSLLGSAAFEPAFAIPLAAVLLIGWLTVRRMRPMLGANDIIVLFVLISAAMTTSNRLVFPNSATASKYSIYSLLFIAVLICELGCTIQQKKKQCLVFLLLAGLSLTYCGYSWHRTAQERTQFLARMGHLRLKSDGTFVSMYDLGWYIESSTKTLKRSKQLGIYVPPRE